MSVRQGYSVILHAPRNKFGINVQTACIASMIYHLSRSPRAPVQGWCSAGTQKIADFLGDTSRQTVYKQINLLIEAGLVEKQDVTNYLRTTVLYYDEFECYNHEAFSSLEQKGPVPEVVGSVTLQPGSQTLPGGGAKSSRPGAKSSTILISTNKRTNSIISVESLLALPYYSPALLPVWEEFKKMRKSIKKPLTAYAEGLMLKRIERLAGTDPELAIAVMNQSIENCYQDVYELKTQNNGNGQHIFKANGSGGKPAVNAHSGGKKDFTD